MLRKILNFIIWLTILFLPFYLFRFKIGWLPTNFLELMVCGLFAVWLVWIITSKTKLKIRPRDGLWLYPILFLLVGVTVSTLLSTNITVSAGIWKSWFVIPLLVFVVVKHIKRKKEIRSIFTALTWSGVVVALIALFYWFSNDFTYDGRLKAFYLSANFLAMYLSPLLVLSFYLHNCFKKKVARFFLFVAQCLMLLVIYLTYSYGAYLGLIFAFICIVIGKAKEKKFFALAIFFTLVIVFFFVFQIPSEKLQGFLNFSYPSWGSRLVIWESSWEIIKDHPFVGIGPGMFQKYYLDYQIRFDPYPEWAVPQPHNLFFAFWLQTGLIGLIGFVWLLGVFFKTNLKKIITSPLSTVLVAVMAYFLIHGLIDTVYWKNDLSVIFWVVIGLGCIADRLSC